ncbi:DUF2945 domain-containing protein, partial [Cryobacterium sp. Hz9]|uniref:DUF2945 domain-containing protein n=1 Tax=Cryobacterium sp. Hz9 TaxID=1259167 RepID=UPI00106D0E62
MPRIVRLGRTHFWRFVLRRTKRFSVGDHVRWNSEAGHVHGTIAKVHTKDVEYKG